MHEYIYMVFRQGPGAGRVTVTVVGVYPFRNVGFRELDMYFPVPPEVVEGGEAWVRVDGRPVKYEVVSEGEIVMPGGGAKRFKYESALGMLPMLKWHVRFNESLGNFTLNVTYRYVVKPVEVEAPCNCSSSGKVGVPIYRTIYAMATGRFYYVYSKRVVADVTLRLVGSRLMGAPMNISLAPPPTTVTEGFTKIILPPGTISGENNTAVIHLAIGSDLFKGMRRDLLVELQMPLHAPTTTPPGGWSGQATRTVTVTQTAAKQTITVTRTITAAASTLSNTTTPETTPPTTTANRETVRETLYALLILAALITALITILKKGK